MANWFIGLAVPADGWFPDRIPPLPPGTRRFAPGDLHVTVAFLGACGEAAALRAWDAVDRSPGGPFPVALGRPAPMGDPRRFSALSLRLSAGAAAVEAYVGARRGALFRAAGVPGDDRPPLAHITIARPPRQAGPADRRRLLDAVRDCDLADVRLSLGPLALYTWAPPEERRTGRQFAVARRLDPQEALP